MHVYVMSANIRMVSKSYQKIYLAVRKRSQIFDYLSSITIIPAILHARRIFYCSATRIYMGMSPVRMLHAFPNRYLGPERAVGFADEGQNNIGVCLRQTSL